MHRSPLGSTHIKYSWLQHWPVFHARILLFAVLFNPFLASAADVEEVRINDNSDWWSVLNQAPHRPDIESQQKDTDESNFEVLGISLGFDQFQSLAAKLGKVTLVHRGDASTGRTQVCYEFGSGSNRSYLVFEKGEITTSFYLLSSASKWNGSTHCAKSNLITNDLHTRSGLRLGQSISEVAAILGKPNLANEDRLFYSRVVQKRTSPESLKAFRRQYPEMPEKDFHDNYDYYSLSVYIEAGFIDSKLSYLAVSRSEGY